MSNREGEEAPRLWRRFEPELQLLGICWSPVEPLERFAIRMPQNVLVDALGHLQELAEQVVGAHIAEPKEGVEVAQRAVHVLAACRRTLAQLADEAALEECFGERVIGRSTVARVCKDVAARYAAWCERELCEHDLVYCYLDAIYLKLRPTDEPAEGVLVAWGITLEGQKVLLGLQLGSRESHECWLHFGRDLKARGIARAGADVPLTPNTTSPSKSSSSRGADDE